MLYNAQRDRLLGKPSIETEVCPFCGRVATNRHHIRKENIWKRNGDKFLDTAGGISFPISEELPQCRTKQTVFRIC